MAIRQMIRCFQVVKNGWLYDAQGKHLPGIAQEMSANFFLNLQDVK